MFPDTQVPAGDLQGLMAAQYPLVVPTDLESALQLYLRVLPFPA